MVKAVGGLKFEGADDVKKLTALILLPDHADVERALGGKFEIKDSPKIRRIFVSADNKRYAVYPLEAGWIKPAEDYSPDSED